MISFHVVLLQDHLFQQSGAFNIVLVRDDGRQRLPGVVEKQAQKKYILLGELALAVIALIGFKVFFATQPTAAAGPMGEEVVVPSRDHVPNDSLPGPYNSNPPAGGAHYGTDYPEKFHQDICNPNLNHTSKGVVQIYAIFTHLSR